MSHFTRRDLQTLLGTTEGPCLSIYLPIHPGRPEGQEDAIRFRKLLERGKELAAEAGADAMKLLGPVETLEDAWLLAGEGDAAAWHQEQGGLAIFGTADEHRYYRVPGALPELTIVGDTFHTRPLVRFLRNALPFYLLTLSRHHVRLFQGGREGLSPVELGQLPQNVREALGVEQQNRQVGQHAGPSGQVIFHGQGISDIDHRDEVLRYFRTIDKALGIYLRFEHAPLVIAGVEEYHPLYRQANHYPHLAAEGIHGNVDQEPLDSLHAKAWEILAPQLDEQRAAAIGAYEFATAHRLATADLGEVGRAAALGRVRTLLVRDGEPLWGHYDAGTGQVDLKESQEHAGDIDVLDDIAEQALRCDGEVVPLASGEMPVEAPVAAVLRW